MKKKQKQEILEFVSSLREAHKEIQETLEQGKVLEGQSMICDCQECAIELGNIIETFEGEGVVTVSYIEKYCELLYHYYEKLNATTAAELLSNKKVSKKLVDVLNKQLSNMENSIKNDIKVKKEIVFFPYKASMWDSLESIYLAAKKDENCDVYCVPIPYYDRNPDGSLGRMHYEGRDYPKDIEVIDWRTYDIEERRPDVVYIHNPYDGGNRVTSVEPRYYSHELKKYTDCLVYVPYYSTSGGMSEGQAMCPAYRFADYIVMQAEKYRGYFHKSIPKEKLVALGSPKFDRIIRMCSQPKQIPENWREQMEGKTVYFYNTSIGGMLADTESFLKKMAYVFDCFKHKKDVCLVWRPHPLMESSFSSMRKELLEEYLKLKQNYIEQKIGIFDDTPDMNKTIALCDVYIGDSASSVTSIFGIVGKPVFILNNKIHTKPEADDWKGSIIKGFSIYRDPKWMVTQGNKLYCASREDYKYEYYCNLSEYVGGNYYDPVYEVDGKIIVCPVSAQDILVIKNKEITKKISLKKHLVKPGAFREALKIENKIYLIPFFYPAIVIFDIEKETVDYIEGYEDFYTQMVQGEWRVGGCCIWQEKILIASPTDNRILVLDSKTQETNIIEINTKRESSTMVLVAEEENIWSLPYSGTTIICWNLKTGEVKEYKDFPQDFQCKNVPYGELCMDRSFNSIAFDNDYLYLSPCWGNQFIRLNKKTGITEKWIPPFPKLEKEKNNYYFNYSKGGFVYETDALGEGTYTYFSVYDCKWYEVNLRTREYREIEIAFDMRDLLQYENGFSEISEWQQYICEETALNSLEDLLGGTIKGYPHSKEKQVASYGKVAANNDGTCGEKIHRFVCG